jgi:hypothetical protein
MMPGAARPNLPRVELGQFAAHGHDGEERKAAIGEQTEHVDAVAHPARLHQQGRPVAAEPCPGHRRHAFFLGGQRVGDDLRVLQGAADDTGVPGVGHISDLPDAPRFQPLEQHVLPAGRFFHRLKFQCATSSVKTGACGPLGPRVKHGADGGRCLARTLMFE